MTSFASNSRSHAIGGRRPKGLKTAASGAIAAQCLNALGSLVIQVIVARSLGAGGFGAYSLLYSVLIAVTALYTGWVGDTLTVLDRRSAPIRGGLILSAAGWLCVAAVVGGLSTTLIGSGGSTAGDWLIFPVLLILWLVEESGRRVFMARGQFWALVANDVVYNAVTLSAILAVQLATGHLTLLRILLCMAAGSASAIVAAVLALPYDEWRLTSPDIGGFREVARVGAWRSMQVATRPLALLAMRGLVASLYGKGALSSVQAALLLLAPAQTLVNGAGSFLLPMFTKSRDDEAGSHAVSPFTAAALLAAATALWSVVAVVLVSNLSGPVTGGRFEISRTAVIGWSLYTLASAIAVPGTSLLVSRRRARSVFLVRLTDAAVGLALTLIICTMTAAQWVPYAIAAGAAVGACLTVGLVWRDRPIASAPPATHLPALPVQLPRLDSLTGMRFLAALLVVVHHSVINDIAVSTHLVTLPFLRPIATIGYLGVTFFFVLSGFVLTWSWDARSSTRGFYGRRVARIVPMYVVAWACTFVVYWQVGRHASVTAAVASLLLVQAWSTSTSVAFGQNAVSWSLSCEAFFYTVFPPVVRNLSRRSSRGVVTALVAAVVGLVTLPLIGFEAFGGRRAVQYLHYLPAYRLGEFAVGVCLALLIRGGWRPRLRLAPTSVGVGLWFAVVVTLNVHAHALIPSAAPSGMPQVLAGVLILPAMAAWIVAAALTDIDDRPSLLRSRVLVRLGTWSYSLYLTHYLVLMSLSHALGSHLPSGEPQSVMFELAVIALVVAVSGIAFTLIERPAERWLRPRLNDRSAAVQPIARPETRPTADVGQ